MKDISYDNGNIIINNNTLYFYGERLNYNILESVNVYELPRRSLFKGLKGWLGGLLILIIMYIFWPKLAVVGDIYIYSIIILALYNIICFFRKKYRIIVRTKSGREYYKDSRNKFLMSEIAQSINSKIDKALKKEDTIINNGIINKGNNNININNTTNYSEIEEELTILSKYVEDKIAINKAINYAKKKDEKNLKNTLKKMGKGIISIAKDLGLTVLSKYLESIYFN